MENTNLSEIREQTLAKVKDLKAWEGALELVENIMSIQASTDELVAENKRIETYTKNGRNELAILTSKIDILKKDLTSRNIVIGQKIKRQEELDNYLSGGYKAKEAALERESNERITKIKLDEAKVIKDLKDETIKAKKELEELYNAINKAHNTLKDIRKGILELTG